MEIIRDQIAYTLTPQELQEAAEEWKHLCLMHRIISYLAEYHGIPLTMNLPNQEYKAKLLDFYDTYHIPFESLVKANESSFEELINAPDQVYLFLSSLAQTYELDEGYAGVPEKEGFLVLFQDKKTQSFAREIPTRCIQLGFFTQVSDEMLICDPSVTRSEPEMIVRLSGVELGMWRAAAQVVEREENGETGGPVPAFLLAKSSSCPFSFQQMLEQAFLWPKKENVFTDTGVMGIFDEKYYQDPTSFGIPPVSGADERWKRACNELVLEYPYACVFPHGAISCSGEGEGLYDGYVLKNSAGRVIAIAIDFLLYGKN